MDPCGVNCAPLYKPFSWKTWLPGKSVNIKNSEHCKTTLTDTVATWGYIMSRNLLYGNIQRSEQMITGITESYSSSGCSIKARGRLYINKCFILTLITNVWHAEVHMAFNLSWLQNSYSFSNTAIVLLPLTPITSRRQYFHTLSETVSSTKVSRDKQSLLCCWWTVVLRDQLSIRASGTVVFSIFCLLGLLRFL